MGAQGTLYLIPTPLGDIDPRRTVTPEVKAAIESCRLFVVERPNSAARFLARVATGKQTEELPLVATARLADGKVLAELLDELAGGKDIGVLSEAGCPGVADPGAEIVRAAHARGIRVVPLVGPSSIILALMASGLSGQEFVFHGYLPVERVRRIAKLRELDRTSRLKGQTQIFIEAPHRNDHLFGDILAACLPDTLFCVALDLTLPGEYIKTMPVGVWARAPVTIGKRPAIFLINRPQG